jgi:hypothetical protein
MRSRLADNHLLPCQSPKLTVKGFVFQSLLRAQTSDKMTTPEWHTLAQRKRDEIAATIPREWLLSSLPSPEEQRDVTGEYIEQFLSPVEKEITGTGAVDIIKKISSGEWKAEDVTKAFCHRAAIAHQLVRP